MSESAVKRAISGSVAGDEERFQAALKATKSNPRAARGPVMIRGAIKWELFAGEATGEATGEAIVRGRGNFPLLLPPLLW